MYIVDPILVFPLEKCCGGILSRLLYFQGSQFSRKRQKAKRGKMEEKPRQITFEYKVAANHSVYAATGAIGGLNAQGQIIINFFNDRAAIPRKQTHALDEKGDLILPPFDEEKKNSVIRDVFVGVSLPTGVAKAIGQWLIDLADQYEKMLSSSSQKGPN